MKPKIQILRFVEDNMLESSNGTGKFASVHVEVTFRSITGIPVYVIQEALADN